MRMCSALAVPGAVAGIYRIESLMPSITGDWFFRSVDRNVLAWGCFLGFAIIGCLQNKSL